jgi:hypothetical protein
LTAYDLTAQSDARQASRRQYVTLSDSHAVRLAVEEFDPARRAACVPATGVQLIDCSFLQEPEPVDYPPALRIGLRPQP